MDAVKNKVEFEVLKGDKKIKLVAVKPSYAVRQTADLYKMKAFRQAVEAGALVRASINRHARDQKLWDDAREKEFAGLRDKILEGEEKLAKGKLKLSEARKIALDIRKNRARVSLLNSDRNALDQMTAESQADNVHFNHLLSASVLYAEEAEGHQEGDPYWADYDTFVATETDPAFGPGGRALVELLYGKDEEFLGKLPENKFLKKYRLCDEKFRLCDKEGNLIDEDGKRINDKGQYVDNQGRPVDDKGNLLAEDGNLQETGEFYDEDGNVVAA